MWITSRNRLRTRCVGPSVRKSEDEILRKHFVMGRASHHGGQNDRVLFPKTVGKE
jgi:hypothetical protein